MPLLMPSQYIAQTHVAAHHCEATKTSKKLKNALVEVKDKTVETSKAALNAVEDKMNKEDKHNKKAD